jgi:hypothetical protein
VQEQGLGYRDRLAHDKESQSSNGLDPAATARLPLLPPVEIIAGEDDRPGTAPSELSSDAAPSRGGMHELLCLGIGEQQRLYRLEQEKRVEAERQTRHQVALDVVQRALGVGEAAPAPRHDRHFVPMDEPEQQNPQVVPRTANEENVPPSNVPQPNANAKATASGSKLQSHFATFREKRLEQERLARQKHEEQMIRQQNVNKALLTAPVASEEHQPLSPPVLIVPRATRATANRVGNRKLVRNAIQHVCLAGGANQKERDQVLKVLDETTHDKFVVLFRKDLNLKFRALYSADVELGSALKLIGTGPQELQPTMVEQFYKYDSGAKEFKCLATKNFGATTDAVALMPLHERPKKRSNVQSIVLQATDAT